MERFYDYISSYKSQMAFMRLDFEANQRGMNAKLSAMVAEL